MDEAQKQAVRHRIAAGLQMLLHIKEFEASFSKLLLEMAEGGFDVTDMFDRLLTMVDTTSVTLSNDTVGVLDMLYHECDRKGTQYAREEWERQMRTRRSQKKQRERIAARHSLT